jgi:hypothetical protein
MRLGQVAQGINLLWRRERSNDLALYAPRQDGWLGDTILSGGGVLAKGMNGPQTYCALRV